jgi:hypothetical protein
VTSQKDIQSLIATIDGILPKASGSLARLTPGDLVQQRLVLEQVRSYLVSLEEEVPDSGTTATTSVQQQETRQYALAVAKEMDSLRANLIQPLLTELEVLRKQRESLVKEIREMEIAKQHYQSLAQQQATQQQMISDFLQVLVDRLQESLTQQVAQSLENLEAQFLSFELSVSAHYSPMSRQLNAAPTNNDDPATSSSLAEVYDRGNPPYTPLHPVERLEQMRQLQAHSDHLLMTLDSTLALVFETLQRNIDSYQQSLSQGLENMYNLGQKSEVMVTALVNQLTEQVRRSTIKQISESASKKEVQAKNSPPESFLPPPSKSGAGRSVIDAANRSASGKPPAQKENSPGQQLPYPGTELQEKQVDRRKPPLGGLGSETSEFSSAQQSRLSEATSPNWESFKLDFTNLGVEPIEDEEVDIFLQREIDSLTSLPVVENVKTPKPTGRQDIDSRPVTGRVEVPPTVQRPPGAAATGASKQVEAYDQFTFSGDREEIKALYESLFGEDASSPEEPDNSTSLPTQPLAEDPTTVSSVLQPQLETTIVQQPDLPAALLPDSSAEVLVTQEGQETESIETITALTDLFPLFTVESDSMPAPIDAILSESVTEESVNQPEPDPESYPIVLDDMYIPASPREELLGVDEPRSEPDIELLLDLDTLQKLSEDLSSFEMGDRENFQAPEALLETSADYPMSEDLSSLEMADRKDFQALEALLETSADYPMSEDLSSLEMADREDSQAPEALLETTTDYPMSEDLSSLEMADREDFQAPEALLETTADDPMNLAPAEATPPNQKTQQFTLSHEILIEDWDDSPLDSWTVDVYDAETQPEATDTNPSVLEVDSLASEEEAIANQEVVDPTTPANMLPSEEDFDPDLFPSEPLNPDPPMREP